MSEAQYIAFIILVPFVAVFIYATWQEYKRYKAEGSSSYGLTYNPETNTTHVGALPEDEESFDPEEYEPELTDSADTTDDTEQEDTDNKKQDIRT
jgi:hypothetical protein